VTARAAQVIAARPGLVAAALQDAFFQLSRASPEEGVVVPADSRHASPA